MAFSRPLAAATKGYSGVFEVSEAPTLAASAPLNY